jgi:intein-encoded DNA endonuclease-like protein
MVCEWVKRYDKGESLKRIAGEIVDPVTVWNHLKSRGMVLRDKVQAQIIAVTKHERKPFQGDGLEKAYLRGLRLGDLDAVRHGRAVRVRLSTTHPAMANLFKSLFAPFGYIHSYPREAKFTAYEWTLECDLDQSFDFLLEKITLPELKRMEKKDLEAFLAGFFDAEGSVFLHEKSSGYAPEVSITNTDSRILRFIMKLLAKEGITSNLSFRDQDSKRLGRETPGQIWRLAIWQFESVRTFLSRFRIRHQEKAAKASLSLRFVSPISQSSNLDLVFLWDRISLEIEVGRLAFIKDAGAALQAVRKSGKYFRFSAESLNYLSPSTGQKFKLQ